MSDEPQNAIANRRRKAQRVSDKRPPDTRPENPPSAQEPSNERAVTIRDLRNAGKIFEELSVAGETGRVTKAGRLVGWVIPATPGEQRRQELIDQGKLRPGKPGGLAGHRPLPRRTDMPTLSETLQQMRAEEDR